MLKRLRFGKGLGSALNPLRNLKLRTKMTVGFLIIIVFVAFLGYNSTSLLTKVGDEVTQLEQAAVHGAISLVELEAKFSSLFKELEEYLALGGEDNLEDILGGILSIQTSMDGYIAEEAGQSDERSEVANQIKEQSDSILVLVQRIMGTGQEVQEKQVELSSLSDTLYQKSIYLGMILEPEIELNASGYADKQTSVSNSIYVGGPAYNEFSILTEDIVPFWVGLLEIDAVIGNLMREVDQAAEISDTRMVAERVDAYKEEIQTSSEELKTLALEIGEDEVVLAENIFGRTAAIIDIAQQYLNEIDSLSIKQSGLDGLKLEMYSEAELLEDHLDIQVNERLVEVDAAIAAARGVQSSGRQILLIIGFGTLAAAVLLRFVVVQDILRSISRISQTCSEVGMGNFDARAEVDARDELGEMSDTLNAMLDNTLGLIQTREERDAMQASIQKLLREVSGVADGDLTVEAEVTADMTGAFADSFNLMIGQLREIITGVQNATQRVSASANEIQARTEQLSQGSES